MFKLFVRIVVYIVLIVIMSLLGAMYATIKNIDDCKSEFTYIDVDGNKGTSRHCFKDNDTYICRNIKRGVRAVKVEEKRKCN